jgi:hypothetical protein
LSSSTFQLLQKKSQNSALPGNFMVRDCQYCGLGIVKIVVRDCQNCI